MVGRTVKHYEIVEKLGQGGMGQVYKARDLKLSRFVALKFLNNALMTDADARVRFANEARASSSLDHPNIATVFEIDEFEDSLFISMTFCDGQTLRELIDAGTMRLSQVCELGVQIARGLYAAHEAGIVHRDLKPGNIIVTGDGTAKIVDFGLAKIQAIPDITQIGAVMGSAAYMSPEQVLGGPIDHRSDIFSFGCVLYEMISNSRPFAGEYSASLAYAIAHDEPPSLSALRSEVPAELEGVVATALQKDPDRRYQSAREMVSLFEEIAACKNTRSPLRSVLRVSEKFSTRTVLAAVAALALCIAALVLLTFSPAEQARPSDRSIAIMPFRMSPVETEWHWLGEAITDLVSNDLSQNTDARVLSSQQRIRTIRSLQIDAADLDEQEAVAVAQKARMQALLTGTITKSGKEITAVGTIVNAGDGRVLASLDPVQGAYENLYVIAGDLSAQVANWMDPQSAREDKNSLDRATQSLDAYRYYVEGKDAAFDLRHEEGIEKLRKAIALDSSLVEAYYWLAWQYSNSGYDAEARKTLAAGKPYISTLSEEMRLEYLVHEAAYSNRWREYANYLQHLLEVNPFDATLHYRYGRVQHYKFRQIEAGIANIQKAVQLDSSYGSALNTLAYAYAARGDTGMALTMVRRYAALNPTDLNPVDSKAEILTLFGDYDAAISNCELVLAMRPDFPYARIHAINAHLARLNLRAADREISELLQTTQAPFFMSAAQLLAARSAVFRGDLATALSHVDEAIQLDPLNLEAHWTRATILLDLADDKGFRIELANLKRAIQTEGSLEGQWFLHHLHGAQAMRAGDYDTAISLFKKALGLWPLERSFYLTALADAYSQAGQFDEAARNYKAALAINPKYWKALCGFAEMHELQNNIAEARTNYLKAFAVWELPDETGKLPSQVQAAKEKLATIN